MVVALVPWSSNEEWKVCYRLIVEEQNYSQAIELLLLWKYRSTQLPVAVDSTLLFLQASLLDHDVCNQTKEIGKSMYSMFIIRFINGFADQQQKLQFAQSVAVICERLGIPRWLVELRHEGTHSRVPSYETVHEASMLAFDWLKENYWKSQYEFLDRLRIKLRASIRNFKLATKGELAKAGCINDESIATRVQSLLDEFPLLLSEREVRQELFKILFEPSFLCSQKNPTKLLIKNYQVPRICYWADLLSSLRQKSNLSTATFWYELFDCVYELQKQMNISADNIQMIAEMINSLPKEGNSIQDCFIKILKEPTKVSNQQYLQFLNLFATKLNCKLDANLIGMLRLGGAKSKPDAAHKSSTLAERQERLQALKVQLQIPRSTVNDTQVHGNWAVADTFDLSLPVGEQIPNGQGKNLFQYLITDSAANK